MYYLTSSIIEFTFTLRSSYVYQEKSTFCFCDVIYLSGQFSMDYCQSSKYFKDKLFSQESHGPSAKVKDTINNFRSPATPILYKIVYFSFFIFSFCNLFLILEVCMASFNLSGEVRGTGTLLKIMTCISKTFVFVECIIFFFSFVACFTNFSFNKNITKFCSKTPKEFL